MRHLLCSAAVIAGVSGGVLMPTAAAPLSVAGFGSQQVDASPIEEVGWRRQLRRYGYPVPYYPPVYGYYLPPPPAYATAHLCMAPSGSTRPAGGGLPISGGRLRRLPCRERRLWRLPARGWLLTD